MTFPDMGYAHHALSVVLSVEPNQAVFRTADNSDSSLGTQRCHCPLLPPARSWMTSKPTKAIKQATPFENMLLHNAPLRPLVASCRFCMPLLLFGGTDVWDPGIVLACALPQLLPGSEQLGAATSDKLNSGIGVAYGSSPGSQVEEFACAMMVWWLSLLRQSCLRGSQHDAARHLDHHF